MDAKGLLTVLLLAHTNALLTVNRDYHLIKMKKSWSEAQSYCRENFVDLATIETPEENARITLLHDPVVSESPYAWIGLYDDVKSWRWSLDNTSFYGSGSEEQFVFHKDDRRSQEPCAFVLAGALYDRNCDAKLYSICYDEPSQAYIPVTDAMSWESAQSYCRQTYTDLASVRNQQEMDSLMNVAKSSFSWWIGLSRETWKWSDRSDSPFRGWQPSKPDAVWQHCVANRALGWNDLLCDEPYYFVCSGVTGTTRTLTLVKATEECPLFEFLKGGDPTKEYELKWTPNKKVIKITLQSDGNLDLNDPLIQEGILKHMEQQMKNVGLHHHLQLSWRKQPNGTVFN